VRQLFATLRHRPASLAGILVALTMTATFVTLAISLAKAAGSGVSTQRLANAAVVVTGDPLVPATPDGEPSDGTLTVPLNSYRRLPAGLVTKLTAVPGIEDAVADQSVPVALQLEGGQVFTGTSAGTLGGHGWQSAVLTPFRLAAGRAPAGSGQVVLGAGVAAAAGLRVGDRLTLAGLPRALFTVTGIADAPAGNPAGDRPAVGVGIAAGLAEPSVTAAPRAATLAGVRRRGGRRGLPGPGGWCRLSVAAGAWRRCYRRACRWLPQ
jgi:putative ABC transport system permease protein